MKSLIFLILFSFFVPTVYSQNKIETNKKLVLNFWDTFYNLKNVEKAFEVFAEDCIYESFATGSIDTGRTKIQQSEDMFVKAFPDGKFKSEGIFAEGDYVTLRWYADGTNTEPFIGMAPTNKFITVHGCQVFKIVENKIVYVWDYWNMADFMKQLGMQ